jgi:hypothetical protein
MAYLAELRPALHGAAVTPHDSNALVGGATRAVYVGGAGNLSVIMEGGETVTLVGVVAGSTLPICVTHVRSTNTTATNIVALW